MSILKRLFCRHEFVFNRNLYGGQAEMYGARSEWYCPKCGAYQFRGYLYKADENTSDGYHTFKELYDFRLVYNAALFNELVKQGIKVTKSRRHHDGNKCFDSDDWFIVQAELPTGQISNHYEASYWDYFKVPEVAKADEWDGHTPQDVQERLTKFILEHQ